MTRFLAISIVLLVALTAAGPTLVALAHAAVPLVLAAGGVLLIVRITWYFSNRW
jgi:hypothetical protein